MNKRKYEFIIVGSGAGGAVLARELSKRGRDVLVLEKGKYEEKVGTFRDALRYYDASKLTKTPAKSKEGVIIWRTFMAGGSTMVSSGNAAHCLETEFAEFGINLDEEFAEAEKELCVQPTPKKLLSEGSERILWASQELGYRMKPMPKFINAEKCIKCGVCNLGCAENRRRTATARLRPV
jgi:choline dehydrogenase-like flavoprotein